MSTLLCKNVQKLAANAEICAFIVSGKYPKQSIPKNNFPLDAQHFDINLVVGYVKEENKENVVEKCFKLDAQEKKATRKILSQIRLLGGRK